MYLRTDLIEFLVQDEDMTRREAIKFTRRLESFIQEVEDTELEVQTMLKIKDLKAL